jgi:hypothetical protein
MNAEMTALKDRIALSLVNDDERVMAAGPLTKQPATRPYRVVLVNWGIQFSVHNQLFADNEDPITDLAFSCSSSLSSYLENGDYFKVEDFPKAVERFAERVKRNAEFIKSIFRPAMDAA